MGMDGVKVFADGGDTRAKVNAGGYGFALFAYMESCFRETIDAAIPVGNANLGPDDDNFLTFDERKHILKLLISYVAK